MTEAQGPAARMRIVTAMALASTYLFAAVLPAATVLSETKLVGSQTQPDTGNDSGSAFGSSVDLQGNLAVVGALGDDSRGNNYGAVYVFEHDGVGWSEVARLVTSDNQEAANFGSAVAIDGSVIVAAAEHGGVQRRGVAYVFRRSGSTWLEEAKLEPPVAAWANCGNIEGVAVSGDLIAVGCPNGDDPGSVHVYEHDGLGWHPTAVLAGDTVPVTSFGASISISADRIVVGARNSPTPGEGPGSVFVFRKNGANWVLEDSLGSTASTQFGKTVALLGDRLAVGALGIDDLGNPTSGMVHLYGFDGIQWVEEAQLQSDPAANSQTIPSLDLDANVVLAGTREESPEAAYLYQRIGSRWLETGKVVASDGAAGDRFAEFGTVSLDGDRAVIGAPLHADTRGAAYLFDLDLAVIEAQIDIKPDSEPNCFNLNGHGVIPVAILGSEVLDVQDIDDSSLLLEGMPVRVRGNRGPLCSFEEVNSDDHLDLVCQFEDEAGDWAEGSSSASVTGALFDGTPMSGVDSICVVP